MDALARLRWEYLVLLARKAPASEIRAALKEYNDLRDVEFDLRGNAEWRAGRGILAAEERRRLRRESALTGPCSVRTARARKKMLLEWSDWLEGLKDE